MEGFEKKIENEKRIERIPLKERAVFHVVLGKMMMGDKPTMAEEIAWSDKYAKDVSEIIDDLNRPDNVIIRPLIMQGKNDEAAKMVLEILKGMEREQQEHQEPHEQRAA